MNTRPLLYLCAYVLFLSTAAWATQSQQMVWSVGLISCLAFIGRAGTCKGCGQWVAVAHKPLAPVLMPRIADQAVAKRPAIQPLLPFVPPNAATRGRKLVPGKRPVPVLRFAGRIDHV